MLTGKDRADMLEFGRACMDAAAVALGASAEMTALRKDADLLAWILAHPQTAAEELEDAGFFELPARASLQRRRESLGSVKRPTCSTLPTQAEDRSVFEARTAKFAASTPAEAYERGYVDGHKKGVSDEYARGRDEVESLRAGIRELVHASGAPILGAA
jgi:hypothetical protein